MTYKVDQEPVAACTISQSDPPTSTLPFEARHMPLDAPVSVRTRSRTVSENMTTPLRPRALAAQILTHAVFSVLDNDTGQLLNYGQLLRHPKYAETRNTFLSNEMGILCQRVGKGKNGDGQTFDGTNTFYVIRFEDIPRERINEVCYNSVICEARTD